VAQEQLAEYATEKSEVAASVLQQAEAVEAALHQLMGGAQADPAAGSSLVASQLQQLKARLGELAAEAQAFAEQQRADVERLKRSSEQVGVTPRRHGHRACSATRGLMGHSPSTGLQQLLAVT
jgi:hypothetical protein